MIYLFISLFLQIFEKIGYGRGTEEDFIGSQKVGTISNAGCAAISG
jgi:hypothetical protein